MAFLFCSLCFFFNSKFMYSVITRVLFQFEPHTYIVFRWSTKVAVLRKFRIFTSSFPILETSNSAKIEYSAKVVSSQINGTKIIHLGYTLAYCLNLSCCRFDIFLIQLKKKSNKNAIKKKKCFILLLYYVESMWFYLYILISILWCKTYRIRLWESIFIPITCKGHSFAPFISVYQTAYKWSLFFFLFFLIECHPRSNGQRFHRM